MDYNAVFKKMILGEKYFARKELIYDSNVGVGFSQYDYKQFLDFKTKSEFAKPYSYFPLELKSFNEGQPHFFLPFELTSLQKTYFDLIYNDFSKLEIPLSIRNADEILLSRIYSEVEGSLNIESVPTTRKVVSEIALGKRAPQNKNEQIIKNMIEGINFVHRCPSFNEENLYKLYLILSNGCLDEEDKLLDGNIYRHDQVEVGGYLGCPVNKIKECMDSLFSFVNSNLDNPDIYYFLPHIVHYYLVYVHPYFDYNGRTARMVSYWVSLLINQNSIPPIISEAINQTKSQYYSSIVETRESNNDLTYFFIYIYKVSISYFFTYKNMEVIEQDLKNKSIILTNAEKAYFKKILLSYKGKFTHEDFTKWVDVDMTKQGALKILNAFVEYNLLTSEISKSNKKLFTLNEKMIKYKAS